MADAPLADHAARVAAALKDLAEAQEAEERLLHEARRIATEINPSSDPRRSPAQAGGFRAGQDPRRRGADLMRRAGLTPNRRALSWSVALRSAAQPDQPAVREIRIRTASGLRSTPPVALSAWRGVSGRRYVVIVHDLADASSIEAPGAVVLGVRRRENGIAVLLGAGHLGSIVDCAAQAALDGATELHVHRLADTAAERDAMVRDLVDDDVD